MSQIQVRDEHGNGIPHINIRISEGVKPSDEAIFDIDTDAAGNQGWPVPFWPAGHYTLWVNYANVDPRYTQNFMSALIPGTGDIQVQLVNVPDGALRPLHMEGFYLNDDTGKRVFLNGATSFLAYQRFLNGEDLTAHFAELRDLGFNLIRIFGMVDSFSHWYPQEHADYYAKIPAFLDLCASYGLYVYWCVFADTQIVMPNEDQQRTHFFAVVTELKTRSNALLELVNENDQHSNGVNVGAFPQPDGLVSCSGSNGSKVDPLKPFPVPYWSLCDLHVRRDYPKAVSDAVVTEVREGYSGYSGTGGRGVGQGETMGFNETPGPHGRWTDPEKAREWASSSGTATFIVFHSDAGIQSQPFGPVVKHCAQAWCDAVKGF